MLGKIIVAAIEGRDDFAVVAERLLQRAARTDGSVFDAGADIAFFFAADLGEELIQIVDDADLLCSWLITPKIYRLKNPKSECRNPQPTKPKFTAQNSKRAGLEFSLF